ETRTSSPIRMTRGDDYQSVNTRGLYPAGEGASYAGGILSAGVDGIKVAEAVAQAMLAITEPAAR
ncbi:MAG: dependent oxidoreductase, partial [Variovorax sp.]|nr:dependent oxidoreductase [Variovorax sp.]